MPLPSLLQAVVPPEAHGTKELIGAATLVLLNLGQMLQNHLKSRKHSGTGATQTASLARIERKVDGLDDKLERFAVTQTQTNHGLDKRIAEVSAHVIGPDGENGLRSRVVALEGTVSTLKVGSYAPPRSA